jgi:anti-anti-sigma factor
MTELVHTEATGSREPDPCILSVSFGDRGPVCVLTLSGQLTRASVAALEAQVDQIGSAECEHLILDVTDLTSLDAVGSRVLAGLDVYVRALGTRLTITGANGAVAEALAGTPSEALRIGDHWRSDLGLARPPHTDIPGREPA